MKTLTTFVLLCMLLPVGLAIAQEPEFICGTEMTETQNKQQSNQLFLTNNDGQFLTANGTLRILVVFAEFENYNEEDEKGRPGGYWPDGGFPSFVDSYIDSTETQNSTHKINITNYFSQMSQSNYKVIGDVKTVHVPNNYVSNRSGANQWVLNHLDSEVNFANYDNWKKNADFIHTNNSDGIVDMVVIIYRGWSAMSYAGEASLGFNSIMVDNGSTEIKGRFTTASGQPTLGSGVTAQAVTNNPEYDMISVTHEISHWLLGPHPYKSNTVISRYPSMLQGSWFYASSTNAYEAERLGWITPTVIDSSIGDVSGLELNDFLTTGDAVKVKVTGGGADEYYLLENRQHLSTYDNATQNNADNGLFIIHVRGHYSSSHDDLRMLPSFGNWDWTTDGTATVSGSTVSVMRKDAPNRSGLSYHEPLPGISGDEWMHAYRDDQDNLFTGGIFRGNDVISSYNDNEKPLFASITNPRSTTWSGSNTEIAVKVVGEDQGKITVDVLMEYDPYTISKNTTWDGQIFLDDNVTVQSGKTLTIKPNTTVYMANNKSINVNGILNAEGVTFTTKDSNWGRINFYTGSKGSLTDVVIDKAKSYGGAAIYISNTDEYFLIKNSTIKNCAGACGGVYINNSSNVYIQNTLFENNTNDAISVSNYSNAYVFENFMDLSGTQTGVYTSGYSGAVLSAVTAPYYLGNNTISGGKFGIKAGYMSWLNAGTSSSFASQNRIANQSGSGWAHINTTSSSATINAKYDFWKPYNGNGGVAPTISGSGTINYSPYLTTDPDPSVGFKQRFGNGDGEAKLSQEYEALFQAIALGIEERYDEAEQILTHLIETSEAQGVIRQSLILYGQLARVSANTAAISFFEAKKGSFELTELNVAVKGILANLYSKRGESKEALTQLKEIIQDYPGSEHAFNAVISAGYIAYDTGLTEKARQYYEQAVAMQQAQTTQEEKEIILNKLQFHFDAGSPVFKAGKTAEGNSNEQSDSGISMSNYPNPFNPTTNINFTLPQKSVVSLIVYDVLGREVATLVNGNLPAGKQTIRFDASTLANGMYLYKLRVGNQEIVRKMTLIK